MLEPKQKDFLAMIIHHITTLFLMIFSYFTQFQRIGCIVLIIHDISDPLMEAAKCALYLGNLFININTIIICRASSVGKCIVCYFCDNLFGDAFVCLSVLCHYDLLVIN